MYDLYLNIKKRREWLGMSQSELAKEMGYKDRSTIAKIEQGKVDLAISKVPAFAEKLHTTIKELMGTTWEGDIPDEPVVLSKEERNILNHCQKLNDQGKEHLESYASYLTTEPRYKKHDEPQMVEEEAE